MKLLRNLFNPGENNKEKTTGGIKNLVILVLTLIVFITAQERDALADENLKVVEVLDVTKVQLEEKTVALEDMVDVVRVLDEQAVQLMQEKTSAYEELASVQENAQATIDAANAELNEINAQLEEETRLKTEYAYALNYGGQRTDITLAQLKTGEALCKEKGVNPHLLFGIVMTESRGNAQAKNSCSTATGYGQFLKGTGKTVYEDMMGNGRGTYNHNMAYNGDLNITMMAYYLDDLLDSSGGNTASALKRYRGKGGSVLNNYISQINRFTNGRAI